jgi:pyridoxal 5'-phosphate synthase pdxT subunit
VGPGVEILATEPGAGRIVAVRQGRAMATSFHPELTRDWRIHELFVEMVRDGA